MSPTSYQAAPPRIFTIAERTHSVKQGWKGWRKRRTLIVLERSGGRKAAKLFLRPAFALRKKVRTYMAPA
jgi:hypothetical protein